MAATDPPMPEDYDTTPPPAVTNAPASIWLNVGEIEENEDYDDLVHAVGEEGVTWCTEPQFPADIRYVRADLVIDVMPINWRDDPDWLPLAKALGISAEIKR